MRARNNTTSAAKGIFHVVRIYPLLDNAIQCYVIFINCKWVFTQRQRFTIGHNTQITHITQNNTTIKRNTAHKTTDTIKDTLHNNTCVFFR
jgi:hypothetical protein